MTILKAIAENKKIKKPIIYGIAGLSLLDEEKYFFASAGALGFILFSRNIENSVQVKKLINSLKELMEGEVLILIDQEGGRVARLRGEDWHNSPPAAHFAALYQKNKIQALQNCYDNAAKIARDLFALGINVNCAPVLDILTLKTHHIIGDRAFGSNAAQVIDLAKEVCRAFLDHKIYPVIKHIPGHGRAGADSHLELPIVNISLAELERSDFLPFIALADMKFAMTAHILYGQIDDLFPATISPKIIDLIRNKIGFKNILISDDISMKALSGSLADLCRSAIVAGCDGGRDHAGSRRQT